MNSSSERRWAPPAGSGQPGDRWARTAGSAGTAGSTAASTGAGAPRTGRPPATTPARSGLGTPAQRATTAGRTAVAGRAAGTSPGVPHTAGVPRTAGAALTANAPRAVGTTAGAPRATGAPRAAGRPAGSTEPIRVLVVDDSIVIRKLMTEALKDAEGIEVVGTAVNGKASLAKVGDLRPDLVTMDIEMPEMNGIEAVRELRRTGRRLPIIMFSTLTDRGAAATLDALAAGASDYVTKPSNTGSLTESMRRVREELVPLIHALVPHKGQVARRTMPVAAPPAAAPASAPLGRRPGAPGHPAAAPAAPTARTHPVRCVLIGSSTGGPEALVKVFGHLGVPLPVPILITQHMPPIFTKQLADRLDRAGATTVLEVQGGEVLTPGHAYLAQGDRHLVLSGTAGQARVVLSEAPPVNFCRPSVDVMFDSAVSMFGGDLLSVILTGMGADGRDGTGKVLRAGGTTIAQDEATSIVWGMPGAVTHAGFAQEVLPLDRVAASIVQNVRKGRS